LRRCSLIRNRRARNSAFEAGSTVSRKVPHSEFVGVGEAIGSKPLGAPIIADVKRSFRFLISSFFFLSSNS
uniref:Peptidylprolyl isomerase n=1 Tax=Rodentolepis nana TaxID=102285 RepID=A0A0R3T7A5_RODNA